MSHSACPSVCLALRCCASQSECIIVQPGWLVSSSISPCCPLSCPCRTVAALLMLLATHVKFIHNTNSMTVPSRKSAKKPAMSRWQCIACSNTWVQPMQMQQKSAVSRVNKHAKIRVYSTQSGPTCQLYVRSQGYARREIQFWTVQGVALSDLVMQGQFVVRACQAFNLACDQACHIHQQTRGCCTQRATSRHVCVQGAPA